VVVRRADGSRRGALLFSTPRILADGKDAWTLFSAACDFYPMASIMNRRLDQIKINHVVFDRAIFDALYRHHVQRLETYLEGLSHELPNDSVLLELLMWVTGCACSIHDAQCGLIWGLKASLRS
jgi:hypothetical protein